MCFQIWHEKLGELSFELPKVWKLYNDGLFLSKAYTVSVTKFQRNYVSWHWRVSQSLNENWLAAYKNDKTRNLVKFHASSWKSGNLHFDWIRLSKEELCLLTLKSDAKFEEKLTLGCKNDMRNLVNFNASSSKSGNFHFDVLLLPIAYKVSA